MSKLSKIQEVKTIFIYIQGVENIWENILGYGRIG